MANYPEFPQLVGTERIIRSGINVEITPSGFTRRKIFYGQTMYDFNVVHELLPEQFDELMAHYFQDLNQGFNFRWQGDGNLYYVSYGEEPKEEWIGGNWRKVEVSLVGM